MKNQLLAMMLCVASTSLMAQNMDYRNVFTVQTGASFFALARGEGDAISSDTVSFSSFKSTVPPSIILNYDRGIAKWFSIGGSLSRNKGEVSVNDIFIDSTNVGNLNFSLSRTGVSARALFHYGNANRIDMYSGLRLGVSVWRAKASSDTDLTDEELDRVFNATNFRGSGLFKNRSAAVGFVAPQLQMILFGLRGYVTENIGINGELAIGSPYYASIGINYRIH